MDLIEWSDTFSVGYSKMDRQHREIIKVINVLISHYNDSCKYEVISETLNRLTAYSLEHLRDEEELLKSINYPDYDKHRLVHNEYRLAVAESCVSQIENEVHFNELLGFICNWWNEHIQKEDKEYMQYVNSELYEHRGVLSSVCE